MAAQPVKPVQLVDADEAWLTEQAEALFTEIFRRFDADSDGVWSIEEAGEFARTCNQKEFSEAEVREMMAAVDHDEQGRMTLTGFLSLYSLQAEVEPEETWRDLERLGYGKDLKPLKGSGDSDE